MAMKTLPASESPVSTTGDSRPVPDPTVLTTQQLGAAIASLRDLFEVRLSGMDKAVELLQAHANKSPSIGEVFAQVTEKFNSMSIAMKSIEDVSEQRFARIDQQFTERDKRTEQLTLASSTAISAALQAQKEAANETQKSSSLAITKAETATVESIKQLQTLFQTSIAGLNTQILDVKSRLDKGEGGELGQRELRNDNRNEVTDQRGFMFGVIGIIIGIGALLIAILPHILKVN
jgi:hypothetical protein